MPQEKSCGAIVFYEENGRRQYLLVQQKYTKNWGFAKGHVEQGESERETAQREVYEEAGVEIRLLRGFRAETQFGGRTRKTVVLFLGQASTLDAKPGDDVENVVWLPFDAACERIMFKNTRAILQRAEKFLRTA